MILQTTMIGSSRKRAWQKKRDGHAIYNFLRRQSKLYIPSTLNIDLILIVCAENVKSWLKSWDFIFIFQAYIQAPYIELYVC